eukprot:1158747-Pelagomonas_calceolata.AAC.7
MHGNVCTLQVSADQQEAESVKRTVAMEEREVKKMQKEIQVSSLELVGSMLSNIQWMVIW